MAKPLTVIDFEEAKGRRLAWLRINHVRECAINVKRGTMSIEATPERLQEMMRNGELENLIRLAETAL